MHSNNSKQKRLKSIRTLLCIAIHGFVICCGSCEEHSLSTDASCGSITEPDEEIEPIIRIKARLFDETKLKMEADLVRLYQLHDQLIDKIDLRGIVLNAYTLSKNINAQQLLRQAHLLLMDRNKLITKDTMIFELNMLQRLLNKFYERNVQDYIMENINKYRSFRSFDIRLVPEKLYLLSTTFLGDSVIYGILDRFKIDLDRDLGDPRRQFILYQIYRYTKTALRQCIHKVQNRISALKKEIVPSKSHRQVVHVKSRPRPVPLDDSDSEY